MYVRLKHLHFVRILSYSVLLQLFLPALLSAQYNENVIKAAYIERITRFIEWPQTQTEKDTSVFVIGVYEDNEFYNTLVKVFKNKTIKGHRAEIIQIANIGQIEFSNLCYIDEKLRANIEKIVTVANNNGVLMMSQVKDFGEKGIHINFYVEDDKLKFEINKQSISSGKFKVSSLLMKSSKII